MTFYNGQLFLSPPPQFVLENSSREDKHECPFGRSSIQLTLILCEILRIGEPRELSSGPRGVGCLSLCSLQSSLSSVPSSVRSLGDGQRLPSCLLQSGSADGGAVLCLHSADQQDMEGDEGHAGGL